jgi:hypothetical protein
MLRFIIGMAVLISAHVAWAQDQSSTRIVPPPLVAGAPIPTDLSSGIGNYCIYESLIFSIGSPLCIGKTSYVCVPSTNSIAVNQRGYWTTRPADPNFLVGPVCQ